MKALLLATIYSALRAYVGSGLFERIVTQVRVLTAVSEMTGQEKMAAVLDFTKQEALNLSDTLIRAIVEIYLLKHA